MTLTSSKILYERAQKVIPGGVNSPVRSFRSVERDPIYFQSGKGAYLSDQTGRAYLDYVGSWGPLLLGHAHPVIIEAVTKQISKGLSFGACCELEVEFAEMLTNCLPSLEMVRAVNSGTEATMTAIRLARGFTGRDKIIKFTGCYHGHVDSLLVEAGSGVLTFGISGTPGIPDAFAQHTLLADFNDLEQVSLLFKQWDIAAVIVEPVAGNMNCIPPEPGFLSGLRSLCDTYNSVLIFDEVMTGFRVDFGGAQARYQVRPDLTTLAKIIGQGLPIAVLGGRRDIMAYLAPVGPVYQAGTLSVNPICLSAGLAGLRYLSKHPEIYDTLEVRTHQLLEGLKKVAARHDIPLNTTQVGSMFGLFFSNHIPTRYETLNTKFYTAFFQSMLSQGFYSAPSAYESGFLSLAHTEEDIQMTINAAERFFQSWEA